MCEHFCTYLPQIDVPVRHQHNITKKATNRLAAKQPEDLKPGRYPRAAASAASAATPCPRDAANKAFSSPRHHNIQLIRRVPPWRGAVAASARTPPHAITAAGSKPLRARWLRRRAPPLLLREGAPPCSKLRPAPCARWQSSGPLLTREKLAPRGRLDRSPRPPAPIALPTTVTPGRGAARAAGGRCHTGAR
jgi:hypothetical protein